MENDSKKSNSSKVEGQSTSNSGPYGRGRRSSSNSGKGSMKRVSYDGLKSNDVSYYNKNAVDYRKATSIPWIQTMGNKIKWSEYVGNNIGDGVISGIMRLNILCGPGYCDNVHDPVNRAFTNLMAELFRNTAATSLSFAQPDLAAYSISTASISSFILEAKRALGSTKFWINRNIYYPRALVSAEGFDYDDLVANQPRYISRLNSIIRQFNKMNIPNFLEVFARQAALAQTIYVDEDSNMAQMYIFVNDGYYVYEDTNSKAAWHSAHLIRTNNFNDFLDAIQSMIDAWLQSSDYYNINGSIQRVLGQRYSAITIEEINDDYMPVITTDEAIAMQIMNATIVNVDESVTHHNDITQDPTNGIIKWQPRTAPVGNVQQGVPMEVQYLFVPNSRMLRLYNADPSNDDNAESTRFTVFASQDQTTVTDGSASLEHCQPEIVTSIDLYSYDITTYTSSFTSLTSNIVPVDRVAVGPLLNVLPGVLSAQNFRYCPFLLWGLTSGGMSVTAVVGIGSDVYNYTPLSRDAWREMNRVFIESEYQVQ